MLFKKFKLKSAVDFNVRKYSGPGEKVWVPFNISVPRETTLPLDVAVLTQSLDDGADRTGDDKSVVSFLPTFPDLMWIFQDGGDDSSRPEVL